MIDFYASQPQYAQHLAPVWGALPDEMRGTFAATGTAARRANQLGIRTGSLVRERGGVAPLTVVASFQDEQYVRPRPVVLVEHGAGQSYHHSPIADRNPSYPGGKDRQGVVLFICPNESVAQRWRDMYPETPTAVVGCPYLDPWHSEASMFRHVGPESEWNWAKPGALPLVVFSFHWNCGIVPECGWAYPHFQAELMRLAAMSDEQRGFKMGGHAHPRAHEIGAFWRSQGVREFQNFSEVLDYADCYVVDNSSTGFEFASTDRPVVWLNSPRYRKDVDHGLRFWSHVGVGVQCDRPESLLDRVHEALHDGPGYRARRHALIRDVYAYTDGLASQRAAAAIVAEFEAGHWRAWRERKSAHDPFAPVGTPVLDGTLAAIVAGLREQGRPLSDEMADRMRSASEADLQVILQSVLSRARDEKASRDA